jgi:long-chain fatty acid transport protein
MGLGYDQSPVNNTDRNLRLPDDDRIALAIGGHYQATQNVGIDVGWTHLFIKDTNINGTTTAGTSTSNVVAGVKSSADLFGAQLTWKLS